MKQFVKTSTLFSLILISINAFSQLDTLYDFKFQLRTSLGGSFALSPVNKGYETDDLISYQDNSVYWQVISGTIYLNDRWGLEGSIFSYTSDNTNELNRDFTQAINDTYRDDYYVLYNSANEESDIEMHEYEEVRSLYVGVSYRLEQNSGLVFMPKVMLGVMSISNENARIHLKERGTNTLLKVDYSTNRSEDLAFSAILGPTIGYKFYKGWIVYAELYYSYTYAQLEYSREITNLYTEEVDRATFDHPNHLHGLQIGMGLMIDLKY